MAKPSTSKKPDPVDSPHLFRRGRKFHYRRRVPKWLQPIVGPATWWENFGTDEVYARRQAGALDRRYDRLCTPAMRQLVQQEGGPEKLREALNVLTLDQEFLTELQTIPDHRAHILTVDPGTRPDSERLLLLRAIERTGADVKAATTRLAPLVTALHTDPEPAALTVSEAADLWLADADPSSVARYTMVLRRFREIAGNPPVTGVDVPVAWQFRDTIKEMPSKGMPAAIRKAPIRDQIAWRNEDPDHRPPILPGAIANHLSVMRTLFAWCMRRKLVTLNPFADLDVPDDPRGDDAHHHAAMLYEELPAFMAELATHDHHAAKALQFAILTATRTEDVLGALWSEFDMRRKVWTIPATRMKEKREHTIPLSAPCMALLSRLPRDRERVFGRMSQDAMLDYLKRRMGKPDLTVHGFRATFSTWAAEETTHEDQAVEIALAHKVDSKVAAAYRRGQRFAKRRALADDWATFCLPHVSQSDTRDAA